MPDKQPDIPSYSPAELMRYATGKMSAAEMYALEKAALKDVFLGEALEGYMEAMATQPIAEVHTQTERLQRATEKKKVIVVPLWQRKSFRMAVAALFIAGAGWSIFSLLQKPAQPIPTVAQQAPIKQFETDSGIDANAPLAASQAAPQRPLADSSESQLDLVAKSNESAKPVAPSATPPPGAVVMQQNNEPARDFTVSSTPYSLEQATEKKSASTNADVVILDKRESTAAAMRSIQAAPAHTFKGQITDAKNNPVPYANVMLEGQDFGTYSDVAGRFNFVSEDSVLHVRVRSVGYNNLALALQTNRPETKIVLQEDLQLNNSLPLTVQQRNRSVARLQKSIVERDSIMGQETMNMRVPFYDTYLLNNNRISPLPTLNRQVQLSFDVSKNGEATNITVTKSSGKALDEEAIRLLKEGPKLVGDSATNSRKKITVKF